MKYEFGGVEHPAIHDYHHTMKTISHWIPAAFCAFISLIALFASIGSTDSGWWRPAFFAFLPLCFFFVGSATTQIHRELRELRQRTTELEKRRAS
jgi:hypothetical protein